LSFSILRGGLPEIQAKLSPMRCFAKLAVGLVLLASTVPAQHKKIKSYPSFALHKNVTADLKVTPIVVARQKCANWAWAAALETVLRSQGVPLDQTFWVLRLNNGELCLDSPGAPDDLIRYLERDSHVLDSGRKVRLHVTYAPGPPTSMDSVIRSIQQNRPVIVYWRGRARVLAGVTYDENVSPTGDHLFVAHELRMIDLYAGPKDPARLGTFVKGKDNLAEFDGTMQVQVLPEP
jgi:hypothetical protein